MRVIGGLLFFLLVLAFWAAGLLPVGPRTRPSGATVLPSPEDVATPPPLTDEGAIHFRQQQGVFGNDLVRDGTFSAHWNTRSDTAPRVLAAHPGSNAGFSLTFGGAGSHTHVIIEGRPEEAREGDLSGSTAVVFASAERLSIQEVGLGSVRILRARDLGEDLSALPEMTARLSEGKVSWQRASLADGTPYTLELTMLRGGRVEEGDDGRFVLVGEKGRLRFRMRFLTRHAALHPFTPGTLLRPEAASDERLQTLFAFLAHRETLLGGSWRFLTYFGRDTLLTLRLMGRVLEPEVVARALESVLVRLSPEGRVSHEDIDPEWAALKLRDGRVTEPCFDGRICDYTMVDDDYLLAPIVQYLLEEDLLPEGWLHAPLATGGLNRDALLANAHFVLRSTAAYALSGNARDLRSFSANFYAGDWRDGLMGHCGGRTSYGVNGVLAPAALRAVASLASSLDLEGGPKVKALALRQLKRWEHAAGHFTAKLSKALWRKQVAAYAASVGLPEEDPLLAAHAPLTFPALSLDGAGRPLEVMHSDEGFALLFGRPTPAQLNGAVQRLLAPFPAGLWTDIGIMVSNPAPSRNPDHWQCFDRDGYTGAVAWSWQHALWAAGLARQLERSDLSAHLRSTLEFAQRRLWRLIDRTRRDRATELWSWSFEDGRFGIVPFGQSGGQLTESNVAHLLSTAFLGLKRPDARPDASPPRKAIVAP